MNIDHSKFEYVKPLKLDGKAFHVRSMIPCEEKERMAQDYVSAAMVFDEESGLAYEGYNAEMIRAFLILVHYTDLELSKWDNPQGRYAVCDAMTTHDLWKEIMDAVEADMAGVDRIAMRLENSAAKRFEREHSLEYKLGLTLGSLLGTEDLAETVAKAESLNGKLIDMLGAFQREQQQKEIGGVRLAKRTEA